MAYSMSSKNIRAAADYLLEVRSAPTSARFRKMLVEAIEPIRTGVIANIHSVTGRTVKAVVAEPGLGARPSSHVRVDGDIASKMGKRGIPYRYPYAVEAGHRRAPAYPFFQRGVEANRAAVLRNVNAGAAEILFPPTSKPGGEFA